MTEHGFLTGLRRIGLSFIFLAINPPLQYAHPWNIFPLLLANSFLHHLTAIRSCLSRAHSTLPWLTLRKRTTLLPVTVRFALSRGRQSILWRKHAKISGWVLPSFQLPYAVESGICSSTIHMSLRNPKLQKSTRHHGETDMASSSFKCTPLHWNLMPYAGGAIAPAQNSYNHIPNLHYAITAA